MTLTTAQFHALNAVRSGRCFRRYSAKGNTVHNKDGGAACVLWRLEYLGLIREDKHLSETIVVFGLTDAGRMAVRAAEIAA